MPRIGLVGYGNIGHFLVNRLPGIQWIYRRVALQPSSLPFIHAPDQLTEVDLVILAVPDQAIKPVSHQLSQSLPIETAIVHTSGTTSWSELDPYFTDRGVLYPLMTIRDGITPVHGNFPWLIEGNSTAFTERISQWGKEWELITQAMKTNDREKIHLAAVLVNNFTNHLYDLAAQWTARNSLDFQLLLPLLQETSEKLTNNQPVMAQTGPARRGDLSTIRRHLTLLASDPDKRLVYEVLTASILKQFHATTDDH